MPNTTRETFQMEGADLREGYQVEIDGSYATIVHPPMVFTDSDNIDKVSFLIFSGGLLHYLTFSANKVFTVIKP